MKTITVEQDVWELLTNYKVKHDIKTISDTIKRIIEENEDMKNLKQLRSFKYKKR